MSRKHLCAVLVIAGVIAVGTVRAQDLYHTLDTSWAVLPSDSRIAIQLDTSITPPEKSTFFANHGSLDDTVAIEELGRGFSLYGIDPAFDYDSAVAELMADTAVSRCVPMYVLLEDSSEFCVTDLLTVRFEANLSIDSAMALLAAHGLVFADSNLYSHNLWHPALADSIKASPLAYANSLHEEDAVVWATPYTYSQTVFHSEPADEYFENQWYLKNTGQIPFSVVDTDIDADSAWLFPLVDSTIRVAIIDQGFDNHPDLSSSRWRAPRDFVDGDDVPVPSDSTVNHGMACAGILAASHDAEGIAGVIGSCDIVPIRRVAAICDRRWQQPSLCTRLLPIDLLDRRQHITRTNLQALTKCAGDGLLKL